MMATDQLQTRIDRLVHAHEEEDDRCVNLSELNELAQELDLDEDETNEVQEALEARGITVSDDCGRANLEPTHFSNSDLAGITTDALQIFLNEIRRYPLLT